jgi:hypothetical protein
MTVIKKSYLVLADPVSRAARLGASAALLSLVLYSQVLLSGAILHNAY